MTRLKGVPLVNGLMLFVYALSVSEVIAARHLAESYISPPESQTKAVDLGNKRKSDILAFSTGYRLSPFN